MLYLKIIVKRQSFDQGISELNIRHLPSKGTYRQVSNIRRTESQNLNVSRLGLQLSLRNILKPGVKPRMKM